MRRGACVALLLALPGLLGAGPEETVRATLARAQAVIEADGSRSDELAALGQLARELLDTNAMGRRAMGSALLGQPAEQQEEFLRLFDALMVRSWLQRLLLFREPRFGFPGSEVDGDRALVHTHILTSGDTYSVDYPMRREASRWWAVDVVVEGISQTRNYHSQFQHLLQGQSFEQLLARMRRKIDALEGRE